MLKRWSQASTIVLLALVMLGANDSGSRFNRLGHKMMCVCSCGQILIECNHVGCPDSARMLNELQAHVADGGSDSTILNWFANKYGATVLAAPMRGGFDNVAWIAPFAVFILATFGVAAMAGIWKRRTDSRIIADPLAGDMGLNGNANLRNLRERVRRETEF